MNWIQSHSRGRTEEVVFKTGARLVQNAPTPDTFTIDDHGQQTTREGHFQFREANLRFGLPSQVEIFPSNATKPELVIRDDQGLIVTKALPDQAAADAFYLHPASMKSPAGSPPWLKEATVHPNQPETVHLKTSVRELDLGLVVPWNIYAGFEAGAGRYVMPEPELARE